MEIVCVAFDPQGELVATGSMDSTAKVWDIEKGVEMYTLKGHQAEIVSLHYNTDGDKILTASFDHTAKVLYIYFIFRFGILELDKLYFL